MGAVARGTHGHVEGWDSQRPHAPGGEGPHQASGLRSLGNGRVFNDTPKHSVLNNQTNETLVVGRSPVPRKKCRSGKVLGPDGEDCPPCTPQPGR